MAARVRQRPRVRVDAGVHVLACEIRRLVRRRDLHVEVAVERMELREARHEPPDRERRRDLQAQRLLVGVLLQLARSVLELVERPADDPRVGDPLRRQVDAAPVAHEEPHAEPVLERGDVAAYRTLRDTELLGCAREARVARRRLEDAHRVERRQAPRHFSNDLRSWRS